MKLFRVQMWGQAKTLQVSGAGAPPNASQFFGVEEGNFLQVIDMVRDQANGPLRFANGPGTVRPERDAQIEALLRAND